MIRTTTQGVLPVQQKPTILKFKVQHLIWHIKYKPFHVSTGELYRSNLSVLFMVRSKSTTEKAVKNLKPKSIGSGRFDW